MSNPTHTLKYLTVYNALRNDILMKVYPNNTLLPTETQLMETYNVSRNTVRRALKQLQEENFITTQRGSGSLVCYEALSKEFRVGGGANWESNNAEVEYYVPVEKIQVSPCVVDQITAPAEVADAMKLPPNSIVYRSQSIWIINGTPYNYSIHYINPEIMPDFDKFANPSSGIHSILKKYYGLVQLHATEHITCCNAGFVEANLLNVSPGTALMYTSHIAECEKGVFEYAIFYGNPVYTGYRLEIDGHKEPIEISSNVGI